MKAIVITAMVIALAAPSSVFAETKYLERIESPVYETAGDHQAITKRGIICVTQILRPGIINAPTITSSDVDIGLIVSNNAFTISNFLYSENVRTTLTFEAKDGRFRITHGNIEYFQDIKGITADWKRPWIGKGSNAAKIEATAQSISENIAKCVMEATKKSDW